MGVTCRLCVATFGRPPLSEGGWAANQPPPTEWVEQALLCACARPCSAVGTWPVKEDLFSAPPFGAFALRPAMGKRAISE